MSCKATRTLRETGCLPLSLHPTKLIPSSPAAPQGPQWRDRIAPAMRQGLFAAALLLVAAGAVAGAAGQSVVACCSVDQLLPFVHALASDISAFTVG